MTRDNLLFSTIGILLGFIIGFMFASSMSQRSAITQSTQAGQTLPADHPPVDSSGQNTPGQMQAEVTASIKKAREEPNNFDAQLEAAELFYQIKRFDSAIEFLLKANKLRPDDYQTIVNLGNVNVEGGHYDVAVKWYRDALAKKSDDVSALSGLSAAMLGKGDAKGAEQAIAQLEKVDSNSPDLPQLREQLASLKSK